MKKEFVGTLPVWASIHDGFTRIERRVYVDDGGNRHVKINGHFVDMNWIDTHYTAYIYF